MRTTLQTTTQTGTGVGGRLPRVEVQDPTLIRITRIPPSPRLSSLERTMPLVSAFFAIGYSPEPVHTSESFLLFDFPTLIPAHKSCFPFQDTIEITVALLADPSFCKWTLKQSVPVVSCLPRNRRDGILFRLLLSNPWRCRPSPVNWDLLVYTWQQPMSSTSTRAWTNRTQSSFASSSKSVVVSSPDWLRDAFMAWFEGGVNTC